MNIITTLEDTVSLSNMDWNCRAFRQVFTPIRSDILVCIDKVTGYVNVRRCVHASWQFLLFFARRCAPQCACVCYVSSKFPYQVRYSYCVQRNKPWVVRTWSKFNLFMQPSKNTLNLPSSSLHLCSPLKEIRRVKIHHQFTSFPK